MSTAEQIQKAFQSCGHDEQQLVDTIEALALQQGTVVHQEVFQYLFRRRINPQRAQRYWQESLARWKTRNQEQAGAQTLKTAMFDYLQSVAGEQLESVSDGVTGLYTAEYLGAHLTQLIASHRNKARNFQLGILQIGIDQKKEIDAVCSPLGSDQCLRILGRLIKKHIRDMDSAAWNDKGLFSVVLPYATRPQVFAISERIRNAVNREDFPGQWSYAGQKLTVSIGLATYPQDSLHPKRLLQFAETQLHEAEKRGDCSFPVEAERRRNERQCTYSMLEVSATNGTSLLAPAMAIDVSPTGIGISCDASIAEGRLVKLKFKRPYWPIDRELECHVRRINLGDSSQISRFGLEFTNPEPGLIPPFGTAPHCA
jgi:diguanylate cyclase (GGDEF)-like protein